MKLLALISKNEKHYEKVTISIICNINIFLNSAYAIPKLSI